MYPKVFVFFMALTVLVGGTVMLLSSVSLFETFNGLTGIVIDGVRSVGENLGKTMLSS
jgi:hypothetical protein